jgi:hypothetical protein
VILAGVMQLAAAGGFSDATNGWKQKVLSWALALATYKPIAATVYATAFLMMGSPSSKDPRTFFMGVAMLGVCLVAMPVLMRFFSWTVGSLQQGGGGLGTLAAAGAAGLQAGGMLRGLGGRSARDHADFMQSSNGAVPGGGSAPTGGTSPVTAAPSGGGSGAYMPMFNAAAAGGSSAGVSAGAMGAGAASAGSAAGAGAVGASAAAGPAAPIVAGVVIAGQAVVGAAKTAATTAASAMSDQQDG